MTKQSVADNGDDENMSTEQAEHSEKILNYLQTLTQKLKSWQGLLVVASLRFSKALIICMVDSYQFVTQVINAHHKWHQTNYETLHKSGNNLATE